MSQRWTREGRTLLLDGKPVLYVERETDKTINGVLAPVVCDAIADLLCRTLNDTDLDALKRAWMEKP